MRFSVFLLMSLKSSRLIDNMSKKTEDRRQKTEKGREQRKETVECNENVAFLKREAHDEAVNCSTNSSDDVDSRSITALLFSVNTNTTSCINRSRAELECQSDADSCLLSHSPVLCSNVGLDGSGVIWDCQVQLNDGQSFAALDVDCEVPADLVNQSATAVVLMGSCTLLFNLTDPQSSNFLSSDTCTSTIVLMAFLLLLKSSTSACVWEPFVMTLRKMLQIHR